jgi:ferredoxin-NADP reductase
MSALQSAEMELIVRTARRESSTVNSYELIRSDGGTLPPFTAGSHIDLNLPNGLVRSYSLSNSPSDTDRYVVGVGLDANSRGGSRWIHENLRPGTVLPVNGPRNNFELAETAGPALLLAGGIGITPLLSMARRLTACGLRWHLVYAVRSREQAAFVDELQSLAGVGGSKFELHVDDESGGFLDVAAVVGAVEPGAHLYACGPEPMIAAFEAASASIPAHRRHVEHFTNSQLTATDGGFDVVLAHSGKTVMVTTGQTILSALQSEGMDLAYSCMEGVCGTCEVKVLSGVPDHRDLVLTDSEKESNDTIMICCSGSKSPVLELDL